MKKQLIILIGTGRSGSVSLSQFLSHQESVRVLHEGKIEEKKIRTLIKWYNDETALLKWLEYLNDFNNDNLFYGDTGMYYLPYIKTIIEKYPEVKVIGLRRKKEEVIQSFLKKTEGRNHWYNHDGKKWKFDEKWDNCFPKYNEENKSKALENYYDEYNDTTIKLMNKFPQHVRLWEIEEFNTSKGKTEILNFIGYNLKRDISKNYISNKNNFSIIKLLKKWI